MASHLEKGQLGEEVACRMLEDKGYRILEKNWFCEHREIDIIAQDGGELVIVEVKTRQENAVVKARESVHRPKIKNLVLAGNVYARMYAPELRVRFDLVAVETDVAGRITSCEHIRDAFRAPLMGVRSSLPRRYVRPSSRRKTI